MNDKRPLKSKNLKVIDHLGILYATFDGEKMWELDRIIYKLLQECDGTKTFDDIAKKVSRKSGLGIEEVKIGLKEIFDELKKAKFIEFL